MFKYLSDNTIKSENILSVIYYFFLCSIFNQRILECANAYSRKKKKERNGFVTLILQYTHSYIFRHQNYGL